MRSTGIAIAFAVAALAPASLEAAFGADGPQQLAKQIAPARQNARLTVSSASFAGGGLIPERHAKSGENASPPIQWSKGPQGTRSYAIIAESSGAESNDMTAHWIVYDIDSAFSRIDSGVPPGASLGIGASHAKNSEGVTGYSGPDLSEGKTGTYHFQVFALNTKLNLDREAANRDKVVEAMKGKVLASGDLIARYTAK